MSIFLADVTGDIPSRPSFFELFAQDRFISSLKPATEYILSRLSQRYRNTTILKILHESHNEFFFGTLYFLERHYLNKHNGSFSENLFGLKRFSTIQSNKISTNILTHPINQKSNSLLTSNIGGFSSHDRKRALIFLILLPYMNAKLSDLYEKWNNNSIETRSWPPWLIRVRILFIKLFPYYYALHDLISLSYSILYLFNINDYYSPILHLLRQQYTRLTPSDYSTHLTYSPIITSNNGITSRIIHIFEKFTGFLLNYTKWALFVSLFAFRFSGWWLEGSKDSTFFSDLPIPPAPKPIKRKKDGIVVPEDSTICPLCLEKISNPVCSSGGWVFCSDCLKKFVVNNGHCPVSRVPCTFEEIRKVYENSK